MTRDRDGQELKVGDVVMVPGKVFQVFQPLKGGPGVSIEIEQRDGYGNENPSSWATFPASEVVKVPADGNAEAAPLTDQERERIYETLGQIEVPAPTEGPAPDHPFVACLMVYHESCIVGGPDACHHPSTGPASNRCGLPASAHSPQGQQGEREPRLGSEGKQVVCLECGSLYLNDLPCPTCIGRAVRLRQAEPSAVEGEEGRLRERAKTLARIARRRLRQVLCEERWSSAEKDGVEAIFARVLEEALISERAALEQDRDGWCEVARLAEDRVEALEAENKLLRGSSEKHYAEAERLRERLDEERACHDCRENRERLERELREAKEDRVRLDRRVKEVSAEWGEASNKWERERAAHQEEREALVACREALWNINQEVIVCDWHCVVCGHDPGMKETDLADIVTAALAHLDALLGKAQESQ